MLPIISFEGLKKSFGKEAVLEDITFDIRKNELFGLIGRSGSGKSTLLKTLTGFYRPSGGKILFNGNDVTKSPKELRKSIGFATQEDAFYYELTVFENMKYYCRMYGVSGKVDDYINGILRSVELAGHGNAVSGTLSGGMKRRLDIAISLAHDPEIVVMDEPTSNLDPILRKGIWGIIKSIRSLGKTVIVASHMFDEISLNCDRACVISGGKVKKIFDLNALGKDEDIASISGELERCLDDFYGN